MHFSSWMVALLRCVDCRLEKAKRCDIWRRKESRSECHLWHTTGRRRYGYYSFWLNISCYEWIIIKKEPAKCCSCHSSAFIVFFVAVVRFRQGSEARDIGLYVLLPFAYKTAFVVYSKFSKGKRRRRGNWPVFVSPLHSPSSFLSIVELARPQYINASSSGWVPSVGSPPPSLKLALS